MKKSIVKMLVSKDDTKRSHQLQVIKMDGNVESDRFNIPVVDVRDGEAERGYVNTSIKAASKPSKYMLPSFSVIGKSYQTSHKKRTDEF